MGGRGDGCGLCGWTGRGERKAHGSAEQRDRVTEEPWWWKRGSTDTNDVKSDKKLKQSHQ